jgi:hypothetical protein
VATDKGYHSREQVKALADGVWKTRIAEPELAKGYLRWHGDKAARRAVYANRARLKSRIGRETMRRRGELVERSFAHILDRGGMRRAWLRGRENVHKHYLIHVAGFNLGVLMHALYGQGTSREAAEALFALIFVLHLFMMFVPQGWRGGRGHRPRPNTARGSTWAKDRKENHARADWEFTTQDARIKPKSIYHSI